jgi:hypothetical protein
LLLGERDGLARLRTVCDELDRADLPYVAPVDLDEREVSAN